MARRVIFPKDSREGVLNPELRNSGVASTGPATDKRGVVAYFGPDIDDPAVGRRVAQWAHAGFEVLPFAFTRNVLNSRVPEHFVNLGRVMPQSRLRRIVPLALAAFRVYRQRAALSRASLFIGRNPDNGLLALLARRISRSQAPLIYEIFDVNPSCTEHGLRGSVLRSLEKWLLRRSDLLVVSSPHFVISYYQALLHYKRDWFLFENRVPRFVHAEQSRQRPLGDAVGLPRDARAAEPRRWRIGWFGYLDDEASWAILRHLAESLPEKVAIYVRGIPYAGFDMKRFLEDVRRLKNVTYGGPYRNPEELAEVYNSVDLVWSVDCNAPNSNSKWLLTNALYEGGYFGKPVLGIAGNALGEFVKSHQTGWCLEAPVAARLVDFIRHLSVENYEARCRVIEKERAELFVETDEIDRMWTAARTLAAPRSAATVRPRKVLFMGLFPPPIDGQRLMTQSVYERFRAVATVERYDVDRVPWLGRQLSKLVSAVGACFAVVWSRAKGCSALYLAPHSGGLLLLSCLIALVGRCCGYTVAAHYHSYWNIGRRSTLMAAFIASCGPRAIHIVLGPPMERDLRYYYPFVRRVMRLSNCGFVAPHAPGGRQFGGGRLRIGHLSNLSLEKGIATVLECMRTLRVRGTEVELWLGGPAEDPATEKLIAAAQAEFGERLKYLGRLNGEEVRDFYRDIDIFLFPTMHRHEAEPLVVIDAVASGVPVIATDRGCIDHLLDSSGGQVFKVENFVANATEQIAAWAEHPDRLAEASRLARARFLEVRAESQMHFQSLVEAIVHDRANPASLQPQDA